MNTLNVYGAGARALAQKTDTGADCLVVAWGAIGQGTAASRHAATAAVEWANTSGKVKNILPPVAGFPGYFAGPAGFGDVAVYLGGGKWAGIDSKNGKYHKGTIDVQTTAQRAAQVGGKYLGYSTEMLGHELVYVAPPVPDRIVIPTGHSLLAEDAPYTVNGYAFKVTTAGLTIVTNPNGTTHSIIGKGKPGTYTTFQADGNLVGNWIDAKGKRHAQWASKTQGKAAGGTLELFDNGSLVIFNRRHVVVKKLN